MGGVVDNTITGTRGSDNVEGRSGRDTLYSGDGRDCVLGGFGSDVVYGGGERDVVYGGGERDVVRGGSGNDVARGGADYDFLLGDSGNDELVGDHEWDRLFGGTGNDFLRGGDGKEFLMRGLGDDVIMGRRGGDHFAHLKYAGRDVIHEFELANDVIDLRSLTEAIAFGDLTKTDTADARGVWIAYAALDDLIKIEGSSASERFASNFQKPDGQAGRVLIDDSWTDQPADQKEVSNAGQFMPRGEFYGHILARGGLDRAFGGEGVDRNESRHSGGDLYGGEGNVFLQGNNGFGGLFSGELLGDAGERILLPLPPEGTGRKSVNAPSYKPET